MNMKEYLYINNVPLLDNPKNILILEHLESNAFCTSSEISNYTKISLSEINEILQTLYKNSLISLRNENYTITPKGIKLLNRLGYADLQIQKLLKGTEFLSDEHEIYVSLFKTWRANFLDCYLIISKILEKEYKLVYQTYSSLVPCIKKTSKKQIYSIFVATLLHDFGHILYTDETSSLMKDYANLSNFCYLNHCASSEVYHVSSKNWMANNEKGEFSKYASNYIKVYLHNNFFPDNSWRLNNSETIKLLNIYKTNSINKDFSISNKILTGNILSDNIMSSHSLKDVADTLNLTTDQSLFVLKCIRSKIDDLLLKESEHPYNQASTINTEGYD